MTREECERISGLLPAIAYRGDRPDPKARFVIVDLALPGDAR